MSLRISKITEISLVGLTAFCMVACDDGNVRQSTSTPKGKAPDTHFVTNDQGRDQDQQNKGPSEDRPLDLTPTPSQSPKDSGQVTQPAPKFDCSGGVCKPLPSPPPLPSKDSSSNSPKVGNPKPTSPTVSPNGRPKRAIIVERGIFVHPISHLLPADANRGPDTAQIALNEGIADEIHQIRGDAFHRIEIRGDSWIKGEGILDKFPDQKDVVFLHHSHQAGPSFLEQASLAVMEQNQSSGRQHQSHHILYDPTGLESFSEKEWREVLDRDSIRNVLIIKASDHANLSTIPRNHPKLTILHINEIWPKEDPNASGLLLPHSNHWEFLVRHQDKNKDPKGYDFYRELFRLMLEGVSTSELRVGIEAFKIKWGLVQPGFKSGDRSVQSSFTHR